MKKIYIAGPCTGLPEFNYPAFHAAAEKLRQAGYHVENPADNPAPACGTWAGWMRLGLAQMLTCDAVALLPGWTKSKGATIEHRVACELGLRVMSVGDAVELAQVEAFRARRRERDEQLRAAMGLVPKC